MDVQDLMVLPLRRMLVPGPAASSAEEELLALASVQLRVVHVTELYHRARYREAVAALPPLVSDLVAACDAHTDEDQATARRYLAQAYLICASVLIQLRHEDIACEAVRRAIQAAEEAGDPVLAASAVVYYRWAFIRQGRFGDAEDISVRTAAAIEPKISSATPTHLAVWGRLMNGASAAAARNNRPARAAELLSVARASAVRISGDRLDYERYWAAFSLTSVDAMAVENAMTAGDAAEALHLARDVRRSANLPLAAWTRHLLAVAEARTATRDYGGAIEAVRDARQVAPEWLKAQQLAHDILTDLLDATSVRRARTSGLAELAGFVGVKP
jgi:hypothetical protein